MEYVKDIIRKWIDVESITHSEIEARMREKANKGLCHWPLLLSAYLARSESKIYNAMDWLDSWCRN